MGTRSLTYVYDYGKPVVCMYRQYDGYPSGHGKELADFLRPVILINGIGLDQRHFPYANGMGCLAGQMIAHFKTDVGGIYLVATDIVDAGQDYTYHIFQDKIQVFRYESKPIFNGNWQEYFDWIEKQCQSDE